MIRHVRIGLVAGAVIGARCQAITPVVENVRVAG